MKKIFAIALAVVMVLSMASAFASNCTAGFDWTCATSVNKCGKATVEVIPYVKANDSCGGFKWVPNTCAGAVNTDVVHYVVKMSVDANPDKEWFDAATFSLTAKGLADGTAAAAAKTAYTYTAQKGAFANVEFTGDNAATAQVYYMNAQGVWVRYDADNDATAEDKFVQTLNVFDAPKAKLCAKLESKNDFTSGVVGNYWVEYTSEKGGVAAKKASLVYKVTSAPDLSSVSLWVGNDKLAWDIAYVDGYIVATAPTAGEVAEPTMLVGGTAVAAEFENGNAAKDATFATLKVWTVKDGAKGADLLVTYTIVDGKVREIKHTNVCGAATYETIKAFFGLEIGTCVDKDLIKANFGWKDKVENCFSWSDKAVAVVDAECVVAIPKTGDASVLAWLF